MYGAQDTIRSLSHGAKRSDATAATCDFMYRCELWRTSSNSVATGIGYRHPLT